MTTATILTISDTRDLQTDKSGQYIEATLKQQDVSVIDRQVVIDDITEIQYGLLTLIKEKPDLIITNGGTGIALRDVTIPAVTPLLIETIEGFGEAFRHASLEDVGTRALASRAIAGFTQRNQLCYCLPGSTSACRLAMAQLIIPEFEHLLFERRK